MRRPLFPTYLLRGIGMGLVALLPSAARATILHIETELIVLTEETAARTKATWGASHPAHTLDINADGLGSDAVGAANATIEAWVLSTPIPLGAYGQPLHHLGLNVEIGGHRNEHGWPCVTRVFVRHSPDRLHWTSWQPLQRKTKAVLQGEYRESQAMLRSLGDPFALKPPLRRGRASPPRASNLEALAEHGHWSTYLPPSRDAQEAERAYVEQVKFTTELAVPRSVRVDYERRLEAFAATRPPRPHFQPDAVRWILSQEPDYLARPDPPFIGYLQVLVEANLGQSPQRLRTILISGLSLVDGLLRHRYDGSQNSEDYRGSWKFTAERHNGTAPNRLSATGGEHTETAGLHQRKPPHGEEKNLVEADNQINCAK